MEQKIDFNKATDFFRWIQEMAVNGGIKVKAIGNHCEKYWVTFEDVSLNKEDVLKSLPNDWINNNRVEVHFDSSQVYLCYINYKEGDGAYGLGETFLEALQNGIEKYKQPVSFIP